MNEWLEQLTADPWGRLLLHSLLTGGLNRCFLWLLVVARLTGILLVAPQMLATCIIPFSARTGLAVLLSLILVPILPSDRPEDAMVTPVNHTTYSQEILSLSATEGLCLIGSEIALGTMLGIGVLTVLNGLKLGAEWLDRAGGLHLGAVLNPDWSAGDSATIRMIPLLGFACFLFVEPFGGQWLLLRSLAQSFHVFPPGSGSWTAMTSEFLASLVHQSLVLGIRVAIPLVLTMVFVDLSLALTCRDTPTAFGPAALGAKAGIGLFLMALTLSAIPEAIAITIMAIFA